MSTSLSLGVVCLPGTGGSSVIAAGIAAGLARRGHRVELFGASPALVPDVPGLRLHAVEAPAHPALEHAPYTLAVASRVIDVARSAPLDVLHVHYAVPHAAAGVLACLALGDAAPRLVTSLHGTDVTRTGSDPAYASATAFAIGTSSGVTVPSEFLRREALARLALPGDLRLDVIPNFVDTGRFAPPPRRDRDRLDAYFEQERGAPVLVHVSSFRPVKRTLDLIGVLASVRRRMPARLLCIGDGPDRTLVESCAAESGLSPHVRFVGMRRDVEADLRHADAMLLTSESESFGVAAAEALACGVPVVAYRVGGLPEVVTPDTGLLATPYDSAELADAVCAVLGDPARRAAMSAAAREHALRRFRVDPALDRWESYFRGLPARGLQEAS